eukprot:9620724-Heterocapsa_arctica.AAC.1
MPDHRPAGADGQRLRRRRQGQRQQLRCPPGLVARHPRSGIQIGTVLLIKFCGAADTHGAMRICTICT